MNRWTRRLLPTLALGAVLVTTGCSVHRDEVTFFGNYTTANVGPFQWCDLDYATEQGTCDFFPEESAQIALGTGQPLQISVSPNTADEGWWVLYQVDPGTGAENDIRRTALMADGELATVVRVEPTERIVSAEVQAQFVQVSADADGTSADFQPTRIWVLYGAAA